jgi:tRNA A58 N-methylase Trm61
VVHGDANIENVRETFFSILDNIVTFAYNKNIEYKDFEELIENKKKIDRVWLDMEKKYV